MWGQVPKACPERPREKRGESDGTHRPGAARPAQLSSLVRNFFFYDPVIAAIIRN